MIVHPYVLPHKTHLFLIDPRIEKFFNFQPDLLHRKFVLIRPNLWGGGTTYSNGFFYSNN